MPFTFSHPSIVLLFKKISPSYLSMTGLIIGSMLPDFEYFIRMRILSLYSHTNLGIIFFNLPLGLILAFIFHNIIKEPFINNLPSCIQSRLNNIKMFDWNLYFKKYYFVVIYSLIAGILSHLLWDSFTHPDGYFVEHISLLQQKIYGIYYYKIFQHLSSAFGALFIAYTIYKLPTQKQTTLKPNKKYWITFIIITIIIVCIRMGIDYTPQIGNWIVSLIGACIASITLTSILLKYQKLKS